MRQLCGALLVLAAVAPARAHFVWLIPAEGDRKPSVRLIFSDTLEPDSEELLQKVSHTDLLFRDAAGKTSALGHTARKTGFEVPLAGSGPQAVAGVCRYGVLRRGGQGPFLLEYYAKTFAGLPPAGDVPSLVWESWDRLPLDIVPLAPKGERQGVSAVRVLWQGKPAAGAEVVLLVPGKDRGITRQADRDGLVRLEPPVAEGLYGVRARHIEEKAGEHAGKKYDAVRRYATLTLPALLFRAARTGAQAPSPPVPREADPGATKLLADARAARALWRDFPGFTADLEVNVEGQVSRGRVEVSPAGKVKLDLDGSKAGPWARHTLQSVVDHRVGDGASLDTPCAFADDLEAHPLGRAVRVLNDEFHSSYRIRDRQVIVVNRNTPEVRFTITVLENRLNAERQFLPVCYAVNTWDRKTEALRSSATHHHAWQRVGPFDLPLALTVVTATAGKQEARGLRLTNHRLLSAGKPE